MILCFSSMKILFLFDKNWIKMNGEIQSPIWKPYRSIIMLVTERVSAAPLKRCQVYVSSQCHDEGTLQWWVSSHLYVWFSSIVLNVMLATCIASAMALGIECPSVVTFITVLLSCFFSCVCYVYACVNIFWCMYVDVWMLQVLFTCGIKASCPCHDV